MPEVIARELDAMTDTEGAAHLRRHGERIDGLLEEIQAMVGPLAWSRVEELVRVLVELYGAGLERVLSHCRDSGGREAELERRICGDEIVSSLLLLHGLHPVPLRERVQRALELVRARLGPEGGQVELVGIEHDAVKLRLVVEDAGCGSSRRAMAQMLERAIEQAAPEVARIDVDGSVGAPPVGLVPVDRVRAKRIR